MIPQRLILKGFKGIRAGVGLDEIDIDLSCLPEGLIAVTGPNGMGKSTVLDSLTPYRLMPYKVRKSGDWSESSFSYYDQVFGEGKKEFWWEMSGRSFKSLILIDSNRRKQECYLHELIGGHWVPVPGCSGKTKEYDSAVEQIVGSTSLFFSSVFRCQAARNLSDYRRSEIMTLIAELLNINNIKEQGDKCRIVVNGLSAGLAHVRTMLDDLQRDAGVITELQHRISEADAGIAADHILLASSKKELDTVQSDLAAAKERKAAQVSELGKLDMLRSQLASENNRLREADLSLQKISADYDKRIADLKASHARFKSDLEGKVARADKIASGGEAIREAVLNEAVLVADIENLNAELTRLRTDRDALQSESAVYEKQHSGLVADIRNAEAAASRLDGLDCRADGSGWLNPDCRLISAAVKQQESLPAMRVQLTDLDRRLAEDGTALEAYTNQIAAAIDAYDAASAKLTECQRFTRLLPELELAESNLAEWRRDLFERERAFVSEVKDLEGDKWCAESEADLAKMRVASSIRDLEKQIAEFPVFADEDIAIRDLSVRCGALLSAVEGYEKRIRECELSVSSLQAKLEVSRERMAGADDLEQKAGRYERELAKFSLMQKACSNDGIIALELDDSLPSIAVIVNDLLRACYGSRFTIRMDTQSARVDGSMKEDFDIVVFDSETGDERSVTEMSGGQAAYINDALTRGICLFNIQSRGKTYGTLFADEVDGALDASRKLEFLNIKREALRIGSHSREFFISQSPELIELADARIVLQRGGVTIQ